MYNNEQGGYTLPYQSRLDSMKQQNPSPFPAGPASLPLNRPGQMNTDTTLPIPPQVQEEEDPMQLASQGDFYKSNQMYMQDEAYATGFNELVTTAGALRDQVEKGYMPDTVAQERLQNHILTLRNDMMNAMNSQGEDSEQRAQSAKRPGGALDDSIEDQMAGLTPEQRAEIEAMVPASENMDSGEEPELSEEELMQQMAEDPEAQAAMAAEQEQAQQKPAIDPRFMVSDPAIEAAAMRNANRAQGIGDYMGNLPQAPQPTQSQMVDAEYNAGAATMADQANMNKEWWKSDSFIYSMTRMALGLLDGESPASAFMGANESYMMLSGMEKREAFIPDLKRQGYNDAQIEEYVRTGKSAVLRESKTAQAPKWSSAGGGMMMNTAGETRPIPGWQDKSQQITPYQQAQLELSQRRQEWAENKPTSTGARRVVQSDFEEMDGKTYKVSQFDDGTTAREQVKAGEGRVSEGERVRQKIDEAPEDQFIGSKGPNSFSGEERQKIGYMQQSYNGSASYVNDVFTGKIKATDLNTLSSNMINSIVMDPKNWISGAIVNAATKDEQPALNRLKQIIDPIARARSGAAIGIQEMENYLGYLKNIHRQDAVGATSRVNMLSTIVSLAPGTRKDFDYMQNVVLPQAKDAKPSANGQWQIGYINEEGKRAVFNFKPGRFYVNK